MNTHKISFDMIMTYKNYIKDHSEIVNLLLVGEGGLNDFTFWIG